MKSKEQYLSEYEATLKQISDYQHKLDNLNVQKQQFLNGAKEPVNSIYKRTKSAKC